MNKLIIIGNLTRDPELRSVNTSEGPVNVCDFTVAVNRRRGGQGGQNDADFFRVTTWRAQADNCKKYLAKGRKVFVSGPVTCRTYTGNDGVTRASMEVKADEVEFLTSRNDAGGAAPAYQNAQPPAYQNAPPPAYQNAPQSYQSAPAQPQQRTDPRSGYPIVEDEELPF